MKSILIVKTSAIGDVIQTFPVLHYLKRRFPDSAIDWVVEKNCADLIKAHPFVRKTIVIDTKTWRKQLRSLSTWQQFSAFRQELQTTSYDLLFDFQGNVKSSLATSLSLASEKVGFGWRSVPEKPNLLATSYHYSVPPHIDICSRYLMLAKQHFQDEEPFSFEPVALNLNGEEKTWLESFIFGASPRLMVACGSNWENKRLAEATLEEALEKIDRKLHPIWVFISATPQEKERADRLQMRYPHQSLSMGQLSLPLWQAVMQRMDGVITMDSAALHLCATTHTPSFSVFGPSSSDVYRPRGSRHDSLQGTCPYGEQFISRCPKLRTCPTGACIKNLSSDAIAESVIHWFEER